MILVTPIRLLIRSCYIRHLVDSQPHFFPYTSRDVSKHIIESQSTIFNDHTQSVDLFSFFPSSLSLSRERPTFRNNTCEIKVASLLIIALSQMDSGKVSWRKYQYRRPSKRAAFGDRLVAIFALIITMEKLEEWRGRRNNNVQFAESAETRGIATIVPFIVQRKRSFTSANVTSGWRYAIH